MAKKVRKLTEEEIKVIDGVNSWYRENYKIISSDAEVTEYQVGEWKFMSKPCKVYGYDSIYEYVGDKKVCFSKKTYSDSCAIWETILVRLYPRIKEMVESGKIK